ncbi:hypothetical protein VR010_09130 [Actinomycetaceae bacterium L2_0104]
MTDFFTDFISNGPFAAVYIFLFFVVALRSSATYGLGRYGNHLVMKSRKPAGGFAAKAWSWVHAESTVNAMDMLRRRGWVAIPLCFLTVGVQTVVTVAAGAIGMSLPMWIASAFAGWLAWAAIYSTIGFAVWGAVVSAAAGSPIGIAVVALAAIALIVYIVLVRPKRAAVRVVEES